MILFLMCLVTKRVTIVIELFTRTTIYCFQQFEITKSFGDSNFRGNIKVEQDDNKKSNAIRKFFNLKIELCEEPKQIRLLSIPFKV